MSAAPVAPLVGLPARDVFAEAADLSHPELEKRLLTLAAQIASAQAEFLVYLGAFDLAEGWAGWPSLPAWLSYFTAMSRSTAREHVRIARALRALPVTRQAMLEGRLSFSKVRALTRVAEPVTEAELVPTAQACSAAQLERICAALIPAVGPEKAQQRRAAMRLSTAWDQDGNLVGTFCLPPEDGKTLLAAIERLMPDPITSNPAQPGMDRSAPKGRSAEAPTRTRTPEMDTSDADGRSAEAPQPTTPEGTRAQRAPDDVSDAGTGFARSRAVGLVELARHSLATPVADGLAATSVETVLHVDAAAMDAAIVRRRLAQTGLLTPAGDHVSPQPAGLAVGWVEDGPALALETIERLLCDTSVRTRCGHEHPDAPDPRAHRLPTSAQRRRLWRRDHGCRAPGCTRTRGLHAHHIHPWAHGGTTTLDNLVLLCEAHHHLIHEGGWTLTQHDGQISLTSPDKRRVLIEAPRLAGTSHPMLRTRPSAIDPCTLTGHQTGDPLDLDYATTVIATNIQLARTTTTTAQGPKPQPDP